MQKNHPSFKKKLISIYRSQDKIEALIEGVIPEQSMDNYYINLEMVIDQSSEDMNGDKIGVRPGDIFNNLGKKLPEASKVLIVGGAGVGKSTLMKYMSYKWSCGKIWQEKFDYVYRVSLKTLLNKDWSKNEKYESEPSLLKCLIHYHLIQGLQRHERADLKLEDLTWPEDKRKIL